MGRNKKVSIFLVGAFFLCALFLLMPHVTFAADAKATADSGSGMYSYIANALQDTVKWILYTLVFTPLTWLVGVAVALFSFSVNADLLSGPSGLLNQAAIYELWKFIRDFCNIFFIFMLLIGAFSMVFQLSGYNAKKTLVGILLMALFVNFSFPISRVMIDVSNVPTYFFIQQILGTSGGTSVADVASKSFLSASNMKALLLPQEYSGATVSSLIVAIIFMFLFGVAMCILAVLFVVRIVSLVVLVIFSPIGFMKFVPGLGSHADSWWKHLMENLIFAPAAMLMLLVSIRFANVMQSYNVTLSAEASAVAGDAGLASIFSVMLRSAIPIILIMMTISVALSAKVAGVGVAKKVNDKLMGWGKKASFFVGGGLAGLAMAPIPRGTRTRGYVSGLKEKFDRTRFSPKSRETRRKDLEEEYRGKGRDGAEGRKAALESIQSRKISETVKENKERNISNSELLKNLESGDKVTAAAAAMNLSENKAISNAGDLQKAVKALEALGKNAPRETSKLLESVRSGAFKMDADGIKALLNNEAFAKRDGENKVMKNADGSYVLDEDSNVYKDFSSKMRSEGQIKSFADYRIQAEMEQVAATGATPDKAAIRQKVYTDTIGKLSSLDLAKQGSIHDALQSDNELRAYMIDYVNKNKKHYEKTMERMSLVDQEKWNTARVVPAPDAPRADASSAATETQREKLREIGQRNNRRA
jgi:hypothetical protein